MGVDHFGAAVQEVLAKDVGANELQLGQQVENQNQPFMRYLATLDEPDLESLAQRLGMSIGVLKCAQKAADQLESLQTAFVNRHKEGELHDNHSAQFKSWGRFAVFDSLMSRMTDEIEFEAIRRTRKSSKSPTNIRAKPVTVVMKRAIRDEKATKNWQQVLAGNSVRHRKFKFHLQAENARREHAANVIQSNWRSHKANKAGKALRKTCRQLRTKAVKTNHKEKATEEVRDQRKNAFRHAAKKMTFVRQLHANKFHHVPEARQKSPSVPSLSPASTIQLSREPSVEPPVQPAEEHHVITIPEEIPEAAAVYKSKAPKKKKNKARWLKAKTTARLEMLSRPVNKAELANKVEARVASENAKTASLGKPASRAQRTNIPKPLMYGQRGMAATKKWTRVIGRMGGGKCTSGENLARLQSRVGFNAGIAEEEDDEEEQGVETNAEGITAQFLKTARTFKEYDQKVDKWAEERKDSLAVGMSNSSEMPSFLSRAGSDADSIKEMEDALKQAESDRTFLLMASAIRKTLATKLAEARAEVEKQLLGSTEEAVAARRALLLVDQGGALEEELPESSGTASGVHPSFSGDGPDGVAIALQQRTKSYEVAAPRDKEEVKAKLREALSDRSAKDNSKRWWKKLADNHAPIRVLLGDVDAEELVPLAVAELQNRVQSRKTLLPAFGTGAQNIVLGSGQESHLWQDPTGRTVLRTAQPAMVDSEGRPVLLSQAQLSPMVDSQGRAVKLPQHGQTFMVDSQGRPVQLPQAGMSDMVDSQGRPVQLPPSGPTFMVDSEGRQVQLPQSAQAAVVDSEGRQVQIQLPSQTFLVNSEGQQMQMQQGGQTFMVNSEGLQVQVQQGGQTFMVDSEGKQLQMQVPQSGQMFMVDSEERQVQMPQPGPTYMVNSEGQQVQLSQTFMVDSEGRQVQLQQPGQAFMVDSQGKQVPLQQGGQTFMVDSEGKQIQVQAPQSGQAAMVDSEGQQVQVPQQGHAFIIDNEGRQLQVPQQGQTFLMNSEGKQIPVQQSGQAAMADSAGRQVQVQVPQQGQTFLMSSEGKQIPVQQSGQAAMVDREGQQVQVQLPQQGQTFMVDSEGRQVPLPQPGQTFMMDNQGHPAQMQQRGQTFMVGGDERPLQPAQPGRASMVDSEGRPMQVPQMGQEGSLGTQGLRLQVSHAGQQATLVDGNGRQHPQQGVMPGAYGGAHGAGYYPRKHNGSTLPSLHPGNGGTQSDHRAARIGHNVSPPQGYSSQSFSPATAPAAASQGAHGITNPGLSRSGAPGTIWGAKPSTAWQHGDAAGFYFPQPGSAPGIIPSNIFSRADVMPKEFCVSGPEEDFSWGREGMASIWDPLTGKLLEQRRNHTKSDFYAARVRRRVGQSANMRITPETRESQPTEVKAKVSHLDLRSVSTPNLKRNGCCPIPSFFAAQHTWAQDPIYMQHWGSAGQQATSPMTDINPRYLSSAPVGPGDAPEQLTNLSWAARGHLGSTRGTDGYAGDEMAEYEDPQQSNSEAYSDYESEEGSLDDDGLTRPFRYIPDSGRGTRNRARGHSWHISQTSPRLPTVNLDYLEYGLSDAFKVNQKHMRARGKRHSHMQLPALLGGRHIPGQSSSGIASRASVG